ncbi:hypothetical protein DCO58_00125 [Helicobacter saguini]|uniref:Lipoprotein n=1 Tax=Helicobacter saguini TaxID=1548018 RepID=A0A099BH76_9HELI|nr:hypothetical protein [Helicobacter saguini]MWV63200.1 hypothetical protein [Helicobacter saguini]MWV66130.1 hypothetical protein [Helicobacter saguini]MWV68480.1 hypothetical protein [Helicobacter saguini]MWV71966.1 hypothetical protein [Helicobacter saguini]TLD95973.1 hypothetical protein LS64_001025 [Helicobacter saguini]
MKRKIFLALLCAWVLFMVGGCSFLWIDPKFYTQAALAKIYQGNYIFNEKYYAKILEKEKQRHDYTQQNALKTQMLQEQKESLQKHIQYYDSWEEKGGDDYVEKRKARFSDKEWLEWSKVREIYLNELIKEYETPDYIYDYAEPAAQYAKKVGIKVALQQMDDVLNEQDSPMLDDIELAFQFIHIFYGEALENYVNKEIAKRNPQYKDTDSALPQEIEGKKYSDVWVYRDEKTLKRHSNYELPLYAKEMDAKGKIIDKALGYFVRDFATKVGGYYLIKENGEIEIININVYFIYEFVRYGIFGNEGSGYYFEQQEKIYFPFDKSVYYENGEWERLR